jgi:hypothetical protein
MENVARGAVLEDGRDRTAPSGAPRSPSVRSYQVYLAAPGASPLRGPLGRLARLYGLDVYGASLLSRRAAIEMGYAALMLTVIFSFDLGAWTLLFNAIFHSTGDMLEPTWVSLLAFGAGLLLAGAIFIYERQFISADTSGNRLRLFGAFLIRAGIIVAAAFITAQPVELLIFRGPIQRRVHEEGMAAELVARNNELEEKRQKLKDLEEKRLNPDQFATQENQALKGARTSASAAETQRGSTQSRLSGARGALAAAKGDVRRLNGQLTEAQSRRSAAQSARDRLRGQEGFESADEQYRQALVKEGQASDALHRAQGRESSAESLVGSLESARTEAEEHASQRQRELQQAIELKNRRVDEVDRRLGLGVDAASSEVQNLVDYLDLVRKEGRKRRIHWPPQAAKPRFVYEAPSYDFFEQLRVLQDLREGVWAKWPIDPAMQKDLAKKYGLEWHPAHDPRLASEAKLFDRTYWVTFAIAFVIPMLVLAVKLLMARELAAYFSSEYQARNGNPDALLLNRTRDELRARSRTRWWQRSAAPAEAVPPVAPELE